MMAARPRKRASTPPARHAKPSARAAKQTAVAFALVSESTRLESTEIDRVVLALQKQLIHDFTPAWRIAATITVFSKLEDVPIGHWPLVVKDRLDIEALAFHSEQNGQPFGLIAYRDDWAKSASHTLLEMLIDPKGDRLAKGPSPVAGQAYDVEYLMQICDPCMAGEYRIDDIAVSDFSLPAFWQPLRSGAIKGSETGLLTRPFEVARGGLISWRDPTTNRWYQKMWFGERAEVRDLGSLGSDDTRPRSSRRRGRAQTAPVRAIRFRLTSLVDVYRVQAPQLGSARVAVESLIQRFG
jgi:hypothetical protein